MLMIIFVMSPPANNLTKKRADPMKKNMAVFLFSAWLVLFAFAGSSRAGQVVTDDVKVWARQAVSQEKSLGAMPSGNTLAVLYFQNASGSPKNDPLQKGLSFMLMTDLAKVGNIQLVERVKLQALVEELGLGASGIVSPETAPRVGKLLRARYLVGGDLLKSKKADIRIDSGVVDVPDSSTIAKPTAEGMLAQIFEIEKKLLFQIVEILNVKLTPEKKAELEEPLSRDTQALIFLFSALDCSDQDNYLCAADFYKRALERDPGLYPARDALEELSRLNLAGKGKRSKALAESLQEQTSHTSTLTPDVSELRYGDPGVIEKREGTTGSIRVQW
jgi:TolB-like protein